MSDPYRVELVERDGKPRLIVTGYDGWVEPVCPACDLPIQWVLDMMSFSTLDQGEHTLMHARCAWTREAFDREWHRERDLRDMSHRDTQER